MIRYDIYLAAIGLTPGGSGTAHIYTQQYTEYKERNIYNNHKIEHALEGCECSAARPGRTLPPGNTRYPLYRRLGGPQSRSGRGENLVPTDNYNQQL